ncbi:hypothetical protein PC39_15087 [Salinisphaera sp. PC39]|uniref:DUF4168 domain-containing protein n=1 Tax=Salinisphaera sp. PC39 TaxID=1304156 RepID=UPI00333F3EDA
MNDIRKRLTILAGAMALAGSGAAAAQGDYDQGQQGNAPASAQQAPKGASDFSDKELQSFAEAQQDVSEISKTYEGKIKDSQEPAKMAEMRQKANKEMVKAVRDAGLEPARYNAIANAVRSNPELASKVEQMQ